MSQQGTNLPFDPGYEGRIKFEIPEFDYFAELLHDRLHAILYHYEEWNSKFMLITNLYDRDPDRIKKRRKTNPDDIEALIYCGVKRQRAILEKSTPTEFLLDETTWSEADKASWREKYNDSDLNNDRKEKIILLDILKKEAGWNEGRKLKWKADRDKNWEALNGAIFDRAMEKLETFPYFDDFRQGELAFSEVKIGYLSEYFENLDNDFQKNEYPVYTDFFEGGQGYLYRYPITWDGTFSRYCLDTFVKRAEEERF